MALAAIKKTQIGTATNKKIAVKRLNKSQEKSKKEIDSTSEESALETNDNELNEDEEGKTSSEEESEAGEESEAEQNEATDNEEDDEEEGNAGWADSIAKVLNSTKPKTKKSVVLSRAKKLKQDKEKSSVKGKEDYGFEIEGEIKEEKPDKEDLKEELKKRKNLPLALRVRPSWKDLERERMLRKIATKGVVQLFNAVRIQQKDLQQQLDEAGPLDSRKDAVLNNINKRKFLDVLMSGSRAKSEAVDNTVKIEKSEDESDEESIDDNSERKRKSEWSVLRPDYMTNKKVKHWDQEDESDDNPADSNASDTDDNE